MPTGNVEGKITVCFEIKATAQSASQFIISLADDQSSHPKQQSSGMKEFE